MTPFVKFIAYVMAFAGIVACTYFLVLHGPDKSISAGINKNALEISEVKGHLSILMLDMSRLETDNETLQQHNDSLITEIRDLKKGFRISLDSLRNAKSPNVIKRIPNTLLK